MRTGCLALLQAVAFSNCTRRTEAPSSFGSLDARVAGDATTAEVPPEANSTMGAAQDAADAAEVHTDGVANALDAASDGSRDRSASEAGQLLCNQPGDAGEDARRPYYDLVVGGRWDVPDGRRIFVLTREFNTMVPRGYGSAVIKDGSFLIRFPRAYLNFSYQPFFYFLDVDDDGGCDATIDRVLRGVTSACQMQDCEGAAHENAPRPGDAGATEICRIMNACR